MKPWMLLYSVAAFLSVVILQAKDVCCYTEIVTKQDELDRRVTTLHQIVHFMAQRPHQLNVDAVFGLTMVEANLRQTLDHENMNFFDQRLTKTLLEVLELSQRTRLQAVTMISTKNDKNSILNRVINHPDIWIRPIDWTFGLLGPRPPPSKYNTRENVITYFYKGSPNETESDFCISELANDSTKRFCLVSDHCGNMLLKNDKPRGYPLTHRLLYIQVANALRCKERKNTPFKKLVPQYCAAILQDAVDMEDAEFPAVSRDMIFEQVLLCGMQGYTEFANDHYAKLILSWPNSEKCFSGFGFPEEKIERRRLKRETDGMDFGCDNHATSLGAASLSLLIRHFVETNFGSK